MPRYYEVTVDPKFKAESDFVHRKRNGSLWRTGVFYVIGTIFIIASSIYREAIGGDISFILLTTVVIGLLTFHSILTVQRHLDLVLSIEFQNALFSSAFKEGKIFSMIVSQDDQLFYADPGFYSLFPKLAKRNTQVLDSIVQMSATPQDNLEVLNEALIHKHRETIDINVECNGADTKARMTILPLTRPEGYFFVSARLFYENRVSQTNDMIEHELIHDSNKAEQLLGALSEHMSDTAYILDEYGNIMFITHPLVTLLGYNRSQELQGVPLLDILFNYSEKNAQNMSSSTLDDVKVNFRKKSGAIQQATLSQVPVADVDNHMLGTVIISQ